MADNKGILQAIGDYAYPEGWGGGLLGLGNPLVREAKQQQNNTSIRNRAMTELYQRGMAEDSDARMRALMASLSAGTSPYDSAMASAFGGPSIMGRIAYHGTPYTFAPTTANKLGEFSSQFLNRGEGNQAYGIGTYLAEAMDVAKKYAQSLGESRGTKGNVYKAEIPDAGYLPWDKPVSTAPEIAEKLGLSSEEAAKTGQAIYEGLWKDLWKKHIKETKNNPDPKFDPRSAAAQKLKELGINGIEFLDSQSRGMGSGTSNFVLFDPSNANIVGVE